MRGDLLPGAGVSRPRTAYYIGLAGSAGARSAAIARDGMMCRYCAVPLRFGVNFSIDHVIPRSMGGRDHLTNLVAACRDCNKRKGDKSLAEAGMKLLPKPTFDDETVERWLVKAKRKCCIHCGLSGKAHVRDRTKPHGEQMRCRTTGERFFPRDCPPHVYEAFGIDPQKVMVMT